MSLTAVNSGHSAGDRSVRICKEREKHVVAISPLPRGLLKNYAEAQAPLWANGIRISGAEAWPSAFTKSPRWFYHEDNWKWQKPGFGA